ncbi:tetraspanin [Trichonephila clavipes]|nr:tetraspanin [Trichonephila clavipes]
MGYGKKDEENPVSEDEIEAEAEKKRLNTPEGEEMEMKKIPVKTRDGAYPEVIVGQSDPLIKAHHLKYLLLGFNLFLTEFLQMVYTLFLWRNGEYLPPPVMSGLGLQVILGISQALGT